MRKGGRRESGRTSEREGEGNCLNHGLNGLRRFHGLNDVFDGRDSEIAPTKAGVGWRFRRMAAGFGNPAGAVLGLGLGWEPDVARGGDRGRDLGAGFVSERNGRGNRISIAVAIRSFDPLRTSVRSVERSFLDLYQDFLSYMDLCRPLIDAFLRE